MFEELFKDIDKNWVTQGDEPFTLSIIGCTALLIQTDYNRGTKDSDILELNVVPSTAFEQLQKIAGKSTKIHAKHGMYLDIIKTALPFLPSSPVYNPVLELNALLNYFKIEALDVTDVVVSKLKRFSANDVQDIKAMCDLGLIDSEKLVKRFSSAKERWLSDARVEDLPRYIQNLNTVQRDFLLVEETPIELPSWLKRSLK